MSRTTGPSVRVTSNAPPYEPPAVGPVATSVRPPGSALKGTAEANVHPAGGCTAMQ